MAELVREIMIDATPETIWPFLVDPGKHIEWDGTVAELDPRPGGVYRVLVQGQHQSAGEYVEVVPMEKVVYTFGWEQEGHPIPPGSTRVEITLHPRRDEDSRPARAQRPSRRCRRRPRSRLGALPRPPRCACGGRRPRPGHRPRRQLTPAGGLPAYLRRARSSTRSSRSCVIGRL